jgi:lambda family phage portal protein
MIWDRFRGDVADRSINGMIDGLRSDFRMSQESRFMSALRGVNPFGSGADYHYRLDRQYLHMLERSRHYERDNPVVGQGISRLSANVIQDGFSPDPCTGSKELDAILKEKWLTWSADSELCHSEGEHTFRQLEDLIFRSVIRDGDMFVLPLRNGTIQCVEGHRPRTPRIGAKNVVHGIKMDDQARREELWLAKEDIGINNTVASVTAVNRIPWRDKSGRHQVFQVYFPRRSSQRRGYPAVAPVSDTIGQSDDLFFTTLVKSQMASLIVLLREQNLNAPAGLGGPGLGNGTLRDSGSGVRSIPGIDAGLDVTANPGETLKFASANIPNAEFFSHANLLLTFIAVNLEMPVAMLLLDASNTNFSGWRGTIDQARVRFRFMQRTMREQFHEPVYEFKVRQWIATDPAVAALAEQEGVNALAHKWKIPGWPYIEPFKDAQADNLRIEKHCTSRRRVLAERGQEWEEIAPEIAQDNGLLIRHAIEESNLINADFPDAGVTWREILGPGFNATAAPLVNDAPEASPEPTRREVAA